MSRRRSKKQAGGLLIGPSHEQGGITANIGNGEEIELEGGEYIINAQTVNAVGTQFLDQLNSTATTYHQGGFDQGQLPNPSQFRRGGQIMRRRSRSRRKMPHGGYHPPSAAQTQAANANPVTRLFNAPSSPRYTNPDGSIVPIGAPLHEHQDGTIMTQHSMGPNDNSVVVTPVNGQTPTTAARRTVRRTTPRQTTARQTTARQTTARQTTMRNTNRTMSTSYRRGGNVRRRMQEGGRSSCPPGQMMQNGGCVPMTSGGGGGGYRRGGQVRTRRQMPHGGYHPPNNGTMNGNGMVPIQQGAKTYMCPPGSSMITSDCILG